MIVYGESTRPLRVDTSRIAARTRKSSTDTLIQIFTTIGFIALSFIPVAGEAAAAAELIAVEGAEAAVAATEAAEIATEVAIPSIEVGEATSQTATVVRLGQTIKGSIGLGLAETAVQAGIEKATTGEISPLNVAINSILAFTPSIGIMRARKAAKLRTAVLVDKQIQAQERIIAEATEQEVIQTALRRIEQLKNVKLVRMAGLYEAPINSVATKAASKEIDRIVAEGGAKQTVKGVASQLKVALNKQNIALNKFEARLLVQNAQKEYPMIKNGFSLQSMFKSQQWRSAMNVLAYADPNLAARKLLTRVSKGLTTEGEGIIKASWGNKSWQLGKKINLGLYKKYAKKLSAFWRRWGKALYKASANKMIPVTSSWIEGYKAIPMGETGEFVLMIFFKPTKAGRIVPPVTISPVTIEQVAAFAGSDSKGAYYLDHFALARNGSKGVLTNTLAEIGFGLPLGKLRQLLQGPAALERAIKDWHKPDYFSGYFDRMVETTKRLWTHKVGKVIAGRWGIAVARGFQRTSNGHTRYVSQFDPHMLIEEGGVVTLDKGRAVQRKAGIMGRTKIIGAQRQRQSYQRMIKLGTMGQFKYDRDSFIKRGNKGSRLF